MEPAGGGALEGRGGATIILHVLLSGGTDSPTIWVRDLDFVRGNVQEAGGGARRFPKADKGGWVGVTGGQDLEECGSREGT